MRSKTNPKNTSPICPLSSSTYSCSGAGRRGEGVSSSHIFSPRAQGEKSSLCAGMSPMCASMSPYKFLQCELISQATTVLHELLQCVSLFHRCNPSGIACSSVGSHRVTSPTRKLSPVVGSSLPVSASPC